jgi:hypothetical protein
MHAYAGVVFFTLTHYLMIEGDFSETVTSETSLAPYNAEDLNVLMTLIGPLRGKVFGDSRLCELTVDYRKCRTSARAFYMYHWCVASLQLVAFSHRYISSPDAHVRYGFCLLYFVSGIFIILAAHTQFINFCGQPAARLDVDKRLYNPREDERRWKVLLISVLDVALFGSLQSHRKSIDRVWVDGTVVVTRWKNFIDSLNKEWSQFTVFVSCTLFYPHICLS